MGCTFWHCEGGCDECLFDCWTWCPRCEGGNYIDERICDECIMKDKYKKNRIYYDISNTKFITICNECIKNEGKPAYEDDEVNEDIKEVLSIDEFNSKILLHRSLYFNDRSKLISLNEKFQILLDEMKEILDEMAKCKNIVV